MSIEDHPNSIQAYVAKQDAELAELRAERDRLVAANLTEYQRWSDLTGEYTDLESEMERVRAALNTEQEQHRETREALRRYGRHTIPCVDKNGPGCICGWDALASPPHRKEGLKPVGRVTNETKSGYEEVRNLRLAMASRERELKRTAEKHHAADKALRQVARYFATRRWPWMSVRKAEAELERIVKGDLAPAASPSNPNPSPTKEKD